jgi:alkylation response protein AidB-like acyl-CoA dehydrogenase
VEVTVETSSTAATAGLSLDPVIAAGRIAPLAASLADRAERERRLSPEVAEAMIDAGLFSLCVPRALGGLECEPATLIRVVEEVARADGSAAWCLMIGATSGAASAYISEAAARRIHSDPRAVLGGVFAPRGRAVAASDGTYLVSGRWAFASGVHHCTWLVGGCLVEDAAGTRLRPEGVPDPHLAFFPITEVTVHDTWSVAGLRGTGSHDMEVRESRVLADMLVTLVTGRPVQSGPLYAFPVFGLLATGVAAVALGIARAAIDDFVALAADKVPGGSARRLAERGTVQADVARAEAAVRSGRALLMETVDEAYAAAQAGGEMTLQRRTGLRLAATNATTASARAVDLVYTAAGGSSIYESSTLQRRFRDIHVATQHIMVSPSMYELTGRLLLGLPTDPATL